MSKDNSLVCYLVKLIRYSLIDVCSLAAALIVTISSHNPHPGWAVHNLYYPVGGKAGTAEVSTAFSISLLTSFRSLCLAKGGRSQIKTLIA